MRRAVFFVLLLALSPLLPGEILAQNQLIILKGEKVVHRLYPGDEFVFSLRGEKGVIRSYVSSVSDTAVRIHSDVVPFQLIDRVYFRRGNFMNVVGGMMVTGGVGYFLIDQLNVVLVHKEEANLDAGVTAASAVLVGAGLPMMLIRKKYAPIGGKYRLRMAGRGSVFFRPDNRRDAGGETGN